ncbi:hypothetical protein ACFQH2_05745 [Natronoarchaeum sp. GCM10025703]
MTSTSVQLSASARLDDSPIDMGDRRCGAVIAVITLVDTGDR